ncbi:unnamed protein product [Cochlearia groenlandica]
MAKTTNMIFLLATLLMAARVVSGQEPPSLVAPSPENNKGKNCMEDLTVCLPSITQGGTPSQECCTALNTAVKTQLSCLCGFIKSPVLFIPFDVSIFNVLFSQSCGLDTDSNLCSVTAARAPSPQVKAPVQGPPKGDKNAASKLVGTGLVGIVFFTIATIFY